MGHPLWRSGKGKYKVRTAHKKPNAYILICMSVSLLRLVAATALFRASTATMTATVQRLANWVLTVDGALSTRIQSKGGCWWVIKTDTLCAQHWVLTASP